MNKQILLYNIPNETAAALRKAARPLNCKVREIPQNEFYLPIGMVASSDVVFPVERSPKSDLSGKMAVICGFSGMAIDIVLNMMKSCGIRRDTLKAVLTDTNALWNADELYDELTREHNNFNP